MRVIKSWLLLSVFWIESIVNASPKLAPPNFDLANGSGRAIFVDFVSAEYHITFDVGLQQTHIKSIISFTSDEPGMPLFDMIDEPTSVMLDGKIVSQELIETPHPAPGDLLRVVKSDISPGAHVLIIEHNLKAFAATFTKDSVNSGFFQSDFESRGLLERYLPANLEFDQVSMKFQVEIIGATREEIIFTNGNVSQIGQQRWSIQFPSYFNCSALFFHLRPKDETTVLQYSFQSANKNQIPIVIYKHSGSHDDLNDFKTVLDKRLAEYEQLFGSFPHSSITIFDSGLLGGGMEYSGAAFTDLDSLSHELAHSYFGRGVMAANGNAGWIDEAMATFAGGPYPADPKAIQPMNMANHSPYFRANDGLGYFFGLNFLAYLGIQFSQSNSALSMNGFLNTWTSSHTRDVVTTPMLQSSLEQYSGMNLTDLFQKYVYGVQSTSTQPAISRHGHHLRLTAEMARAVQ